MSGGIEREREREKEREVLSESVPGRVHQAHVTEQEMHLRVCVCVCVCVRERERERERCTSGRSHRCVAITDPANATYPNQQVRSLYKLTVR